MKFFFPLLAFGADHAGELLCSQLIKECADKGQEYAKEVRDPGLIDYPSVVPFVVGHVRRGAGGVLICGSGIGMSMAANRYKGMRAALCHDVTSARLARQHNNANILVLGARIIGETVALDCLDVFFTTGFQGGRHQGRIEAIDVLACS
jgi:ribose 5-phosphate isomerase B